MDRFKYRKKRRAATPRITIAELAAEAGLAHGTIVALETRGADYDPGKSTVDEADAAMNRLLEKRNNG